MQREIKFRGKRLDNGKWVVGSLFIDKRLKNVSCEIIVEDEFTFKQYYVNHATVGQYLGIRDTNGKKIFDNHIVKLPMVDGGKGDIATFKFNAPNYYLSGKKGDYEISKKYDPCCYEVIGNMGVGE